MFRLFKKTAFIPALLLVATLSAPIDARIVSGDLHSKTVLTEGLYLHQNGSGTIDASWDEINGTEAYFLKVDDVTTSEFFTSMSTYNTSATVSGLSSGHTYRFSLKRGDIIISDLLTNV